MSRVALVTGGSRGIGAAIAMALKEAGYKVAATYAGNDEQASRLTNGTLPTMRPVPLVSRKSKATLARLRFSSITQVSPATHHSTK